MQESPSSWIVKFAPLIKSQGLVLDLACGSGRHAKWLAQQGYQVDALDRDPIATSSMQGIDGIRIQLTDLETTEPPSFEHSYDGIIVSRYLHRPILTSLATILKPGGILIYETFMRGNERYGKPSNPDFLLMPDELLNTYSPLLNIISFEQGEVVEPKPAMLQRICAQKNI
ncbi:SAM-dependent methyltransferase [Methylotenera oryzisoli]|uniref:SAM-dependent methyltransferase n=1 Tax=Methylotenera oryzisoli TaxID=2080758 RepID=A0A4Y9VP64_9PROT|nr:methyltransferase domain-containing protein [Methylotenera oryzisoli]TFW70372.1 SAM-dependent methyltransferase [Methylotenera oryzisoli]